MLPTYPTDPLQRAASRVPSPLWLGAALACGLVIAVLVSSPRHAEAADHPTPVALDLTDIQKEIVLRDATGQPVPGIAVTLRPASPAAGGPPSAAPVSGQTNAQGSLTFSGLDRWIWYVRFAGTWQGRPIQDPPAQGRPPYGYSPRGGGFATRIDVAEDAESVPTPPARPPASTAASAVQTTGFVLVAARAGDPWIVAFDQVLPPAPPRVALAYPTTDTGASAPPPSPVMTPAAPPAGAATGSPGAGFPLAGLLALGALAILVGRLRLQQRRALHERPTPRPAMEEPS